MPLRDHATPGRRANARVARVLGVPKVVEEPPPAVETAPEEVETPKRKDTKVVDTDVPTSPPSHLSPTELVRAVWHCFPGFLTVFLVNTVCPGERHRVWRATPVAIWLAPLLVTCWAVEYLRLKVFTSWKTGDDQNHNSAWTFTTIFNVFFQKILRSNEHSKVHGTAWYLLGVTTVLFFYPCDVAVLSICHLAFCDPAASVVGRSAFFMTGTHRNARFANGKSWRGTAACATVGYCVTWYLFRVNGGVFGENVRGSDGGNIYSQTGLKNNDKSWFGTGLSMGKQSSDAIKGALNMDPDLFVFVFALIAGITVALVELFGTPAAKRGESDRENENSKSTSKPVKSALKRNRKPSTTKSTFDICSLLNSCMNDNFLIPVLSGAVCWAARGVLLGWA
ncbi:hypothetical protein N9L76_09830 [bacterium]|nr:hypothetical protein [bacterium]